MKKLLLILIALSTLKSFGQKAVKNPASLKDSKPGIFANTITPSDLKNHLLIVASKDMEGRETATEGQKKAAAYIESQFKSIGLLPGNHGSYQLKYPVYQDSLVITTLEVNGQRFELDKDFNATISNIESTQPFSEVVFIGANVPADSIRKENLAGKLVLTSQDGMGIQGGRFQLTPKAASIRAGNPAAILTISTNYPHRTPSLRKGPQSLAFFKKSILPQTFTVSEAVAKAIMGTGNENGSSASMISIYPANVLLQVQKATNQLESSNVIGILPGTDLKDEYLFVTAHYDHLGKRDSVIYYGADDDGSGTVSVLEIAEAFAKAKQAGKGPRRTIVFMTVSGEEKGLWGSEYYGSHPVYPLDKTTADLNIDMIGRIDATRKQGDSTNYVYVVGDDKLSSDLKPINEEQNKKYTKMELDYKFNDPKDPNRIYYRSDHYNFAKNGVPIIFYYDGMLGADYHRPTDTPDKINYNLLARRAQLVFYTAWDMANRNDMLKRDIPLDKNVFNR